jgi:putative FmdB family regulatory protein
MPLYEYECDACGTRFEVIQKFSDPPADVCRTCGKGPVRRLLSSPAIQFKGSGWYITDYAQKSNTNAGRAEGTADAAPKESSASTTTDAAPKAETAPSTPTSSPKE